MSPWHTSIFAGLVYDDNDVIRHLSFGCPVETIAGEGGAQVPLWMRIIIIIIMFMMLIMIIPIVFNIRVLRGEGRDCICDDPKDKLFIVFVFGGQEVVFPLMEKMTYLLYSCTCSLKRPFRFYIYDPGVPRSLPKQNCWEKLTLELWCSHSCHPEPIRIQW